MIVSVVRRFAVFVTGAILVASASLAGQDSTVDLGSANPMEGKIALSRKGCITCHSIWGAGGQIGPDLATAGADQTFQQIASMFWNHTPRMVELLRQKGQEWPTLTEKEMADIISFIYYLKLLDKPGDAAIGKQVFQEKRCNACHTLKGGALPIGQYGAYVSTVSLAEAMWNSGQTMRQTQQARGIAMPLFQGREMADLQAYLRSENPPETETKYLPLPDLTRGAQLFRSKGCINCHQSGRQSIGLDLSREPLRKSISEICGILWNHSFAMQSTMAARGITVARLQGNELSDILAYIYFLHFSRDEGNADRGEETFVSKGCVTCHGPNKQGPNLAEGGEKFDMLHLATSMWNHAPIMHQSMESEVMQWIRLDQNDMQDLSKFLRRLRK